MKKRIISATLASIMAVSTLATSAFAVDPTLTAATPGEKTAVSGDGFDITIKSVYATPNISVLVPTGTNVNYIMNPYKLTVEIDDDEVNDQIISSVLKFKNQSNVPINLYLSAVGTPNAEGKAKLATAALKEGDQGNQVFLYAVSAEASATEITSIAAPEGGYVAANHLLVSSKATEKVMAKLDAAAETGSPKVFTGVKIFGAMSDTPKLAWDPAKDTVDVTIAYRFEALMNS